MRGSGRKGFSQMRRIFNGLWGSEDPFHIHLPWSEPFLAPKVSQVAGYNTFSQIFQDSGTQTLCNQLPECHPSRSFFLSQHFFQRYQMVVHTHIPPSKQRFLVPYHRVFQSFYSKKHLPVLLENNKPKPTCILLGRAITFPFQLQLTKL